MTLRLVCSVSMKGVLFVMFSVDVDETWKGRIVTTVLIDKSLCDFFLSFVTLFLCKLLQAVVVILSLSSILSFSLLVVGFSYAENLCYWWLVAWRWVNAAWKLFDVETKTVLFGLHAWLQRHDLCFGRGRMRAF